MYNPLRYYCIVNIIYSLCLILITYCIREFKAADLSSFIIFSPTFFPLSFIYHRNKFLKKEKKTQEK